MINQFLRSFESSWEKVKESNSKFSAEFQMLSSELEDRDKSGKLGDIIDAIRDLLNGKYNTYIKKDELFYHIRKCYSKFRQEFEEKMDAIIEKDKLDVELTEKMRKDEPVIFNNWDSFKSLFWKILESY